MTVDHVVELDVRMLACTKSHLASDTVREASLPQPMSISESSTRPVQVVLCAITRSDTAPARRMATTMLMRFHFMSPELAVVTV